MVYLYKKKEEVIFLNNPLSEEEIIRNQLDYQGKMSDEYYEGVLNAVSGLFTSAKEAIINLSKERD